MAAVVVVAVVGLTSEEYDMEGYDMGDLDVSSPAFGEGGEIPVKYTCDGDDTNPEIRAGNVPEDAQTLAVIVDDPDAPVGTFVHWVVFNIPAKENVIPEGFKPDDLVVEGKNDFGNNGYGGPCPPSGEHRYFFKVYALSGSLDLAPGASKEDVEEAMTGKVLSQGALVGVYSRK